MRNLRLGVALIAALLAIASTASADVVYHFYWNYQWRIHRVSAPYQTHSAWSFCGQSHGGTVGCGRGFTVANTVAGSVGVSDGVLSATLGYNVTRSTTLTGSASFKVPRHRLGIAQWRALFTTRAVHQRLYRIRCSQFGCYGKWGATRRYETAYASRYLGPDFRVIIH